MRLIDNLEELEVGDYISRSLSMANGDTIIFEVKVSTEKFLRVNSIKYSRKDWDMARQWIGCVDGDPTTITKKVKKTKKRKLKHKIVTYNEEWTIFKLTEKEKTKVIKEMILKKLEEPQGSLYK